MRRHVGGITTPDKTGKDDAGTRRQQLSIWMASPENPYLARAAVNRVWALLFGRGLVNPVDDQLVDVLTYMLGNGPSYTTARR